MAFEVIPALDLAGGRLVRATAAERVPVEAFEGDPVRAAETFARVGARRLHVVDVDLATGDRPADTAPNIEMLRSVCALGIPVQASGGVGSGPQVDALLSAGADRVVLGSAALGARQRAEELVQAFGDALIVGVEADGPSVRPRGTDLELPLWDTLVWLAHVPVRRYLFTEVGRVGELGGPDLDGVWAFAAHSPVPVLAAGGIRGIEDLRAIAALGGTVEGAIVGRALYEGLDLGEALAAFG